VRAKRTWRKLDLSGWQGGGQGGRKPPLVRRKPKAPTFFECTINSTCYVFSVFLFFSAEFVTLSAYMVEFKREGMGRYRCAETSRSPIEKLASLRGFRRLVSLTQGLYHAQESDFYDKEALGCHKFS
jgi:hypothetical protein